MVRKGRKTNRTQNWGRDSKYQTWRGKQKHDSHVLPRPIGHVIEEDVNYRISDSFVPEV